MTDWLATQAHTGDGKVIRRNRGPLPELVREERPGVWVRLDNGLRACGAKGRSRRCATTTGLHAKTFRCRMHVGLSGVEGVAHPAYRNGRHSAHLPTRLVSLYQASLDDPDLLSQRAEIALLDARLGDLLAQVGTGESVRSWVQAKKHFEEMRRANQRQDPAALGLAVQALGAVLERGLAESAVWREVLQVVEQRRRIVQTEHEHQDREQQTITLERALLLVGALQSAVMAHVRDPGVQKIIAADFLRLTEGAAR